MPDRFKLFNDNGVNVIELLLPMQLDHSELDRVIEDLAHSMNGQAAGRWVIDLSHVDYTGSAALGLLVNIRQQIKEAGGTLVLCGLSPRLTDILHACSLDRLFKLAQSRAAAMKA